MRRTVCNIFLFALMHLSAKSAIFVKSTNSAEPIIQTGHLAPIKEVVFSPNGSWLASGGADEVVKLWDVRAGKEVRSLVGNRGPIYTLRFSSDSRFLVSGGWDRSVRMWDLETGYMVAEFPNHKNTVQSVAISGDNTKVAAGIFDDSKEGKAVVIWDVGNKRELTHLPVSGVVDAIQYSPNGKVLAVGDGADTQVLLFRAEDSSLLRPITWKLPAGTRQRDGDTGVKDLSWSPDSRYIVALYSGVPVVLDTVGTKPPAILPSRERVRHIAFDKDGSLFLFEPKGVEHIEPGTGKLIDPYLSSPQVRAISPNADLVARVVESRTIALSDRATGKDIFSLRSPLNLSAQFGNLTRYFVVAVSPREAVIASGGLDGLVRVWDLRQSSSPKILSVSNNIEALAFNATGDLLACGAGKELYIWRTTDWSLLNTVEVDSKIASLAFDPKDQARLAILTRKRLIYVNAPAGMIIESARIPGSPGNGGGIAWTPDGTLGTGIGTDLVIWDGIRPKILPRVSAQINAIAITAGGRMALANGQNKWLEDQAPWLHTNDTVLLFDPASQPQFRNLQGHQGLVRALAFDSRGQLLASGDGNGVLRIWNASSGKQIASFIAHSGDVTGVAFTSDDRYVVSTGMDGTVRLWNASHLQPTATFVALGIDEYASVLADGRYMASKGGLRGIAFNLSNHVYPFEQFDLRLNRPDLVLQRLGQASPELITSYRRAYEKRLKLMGFTQNQLSESFHLPEMEITTPNLPVSTQNRILRFHVRASDSQQLLDRINVYVNDVPVYGMQGKSLQGERTHVWEGDIEVELGAGANKVQVSVLNAGGAESLQQTAAVTYTGNVKPKPDLYVVAVGASRYQDQDYNLNYAAQDATDLLRFWKSKKDRFGQVHSLPLLNQNATKEKIQGAKRFLQQAEVDDEVVVSFAGHGLLDEHGDYYFATSDIDFTHPAVRGLPFEALEGLLDGLKARKKLLLIDTCQAGEVDKDAVLQVKSSPLVNAVTRGVALGVRVRALPKARAQVAGVVRVGLDSSFALQQQLFADLRRGSGAQVIAASGGLEFAQEGGGVRNGVFTAAVLEGLQGQADPDHKGVITVSQLRAYVIRRVSELTGGQQKPTARRENLDFDFPLW